MIHTVLFDLDGTLANTAPNLAEALNRLLAGDAERDVRAGREAGMRTRVALFGYIGENESPSQWGADGLIRSPLEVLDWIDAAAGRGHAR